MGRRIVTALWRFALVLIAGGLLIPSTLQTFIDGEAGLLYCPEGWPWRSGQDAVPEVVAGRESFGEDVGPIGGSSSGIAPLDVKIYRVRWGDTLSEIAESFGLELDTVASMNRVAGSGVHLLYPGERIRIPSEDGIFVVLERSIQEVCREYDVSEEAVLIANRLSPEDVKSGMQIFLPGMQHTGLERSVAIGVAFMKPVVGYVSSNFGLRLDPFTRQRRFHQGIDVAAARGTSVSASLDGRVRRVGYSLVLGNYVVLQHVADYTTVYGHLDGVNVSLGALVRKGQTLGSVGDSGRATGPHLHFEIRRSGVAVNPASEIYEPW